MESLNKRQQAVERKRARIIDAAAKIFAEYGYRRAKTDAIAKQAGISKGLLFHYFDSKEALFCHVVEDSLEQWRNFSDYRAYENSDDIKAELASLFTASFDFVKQHPILAIFEQSGDLIVKQYEADFQQSNIQWRKHIEAIIRHGAKRGVFRHDLDTHTATIVFHELQMGLIKNSSNHRYSKSTMTTAVDIFLHGIEAR